MFIQKADATNRIKIARTSVHWAKIGLNLLNHDNQVVIMKKSDASEHDNEWRFFFLEQIAVPCIWMALCFWRSCNPQPDVEGSLK